MLEVLCPDPHHGQWLAVPAESPQRELLSAGKSGFTCKHLGGDAGPTGSGRTCSYTVRIKTSCSSPSRTSDAISVAFGDAYRNEVYAAGLAGSSSSSRAFERCSTDTFRIGGPCGYGVCYLYLRRAGRVGWTPEWVRVYEPTSDTPSTFYYGDPLPDSVWYGFNRCPNRAAASSPSSAAAA